MTSRQYEDYSRIEALLKKIREPDLKVLGYAVRHTFLQENNLYFKETLGRLSREIEVMLDTCMVD